MNNIRVIDSARWVDQDEDFFLKILQSQNINPQLILKNIKIREDGNFEGLTTADVFRYSKLDSSEEVIVALSKGVLNGNNIQEAYLILPSKENEEDNQDAKLISSLIYNHIKEEDQNFI